jgi:ligand-binding sensor domain-containing protein
MMKILVFLLFWSSSNLFAQVQAITEAADGAIWFAKEARLLRITGEKIEAVPAYQPAGRINALLADSNRNVWIGTDQNLVRCTDDKCEKYSGIPAARVLSIAIGKNQSVWVATDYNLYNIHISTLTSAAIPSTKLDTIAIDETGAVWVSTRTAVKRFRDGRFEDVLKTFAQVIASDGRGTLWIGSGYELMAWRHGDTEIFPLPPPAANVRMRPPITSIRPAKSGDVYVGTRVGLFLLAGKNLQKIADAEVLALLEDSKGNIWIGTADGLKRMAQGKISDVPFPR